MAPFGTPIWAAAWVKPPLPGAAQAVSTLRIVRPHSALINMGSLHAKTYPQPSTRNARRQSALRHLGIIVPMAAGVAEPIIALAACFQVGGCQPRLGVTTGNIEDITGLTKPGCAPVQLAHQG